MGLTLLTLIDLCLVLAGCGLLGERVSGYGIRSGFSELALITNVAGQQSTDSLALSSWRNPNMRPVPLTSASRRRVDMEPDAPFAALRALVRLRRRRPARRRRGLVGHFRHHFDTDVGQPHAHLDGDIFR